MTFFHKYVVVIEVYLLLNQARCTGCIVRVLPWGLHWVIGKKIIRYVGPKSSKGLL